MMVDDFDEVVGIKTVNGLQHLVVVDEDDLRAFGNRLDETRLGDAMLAHDPLGFGRKRPQTDRLVGRVLARAAGKLVFEVGVANSSADGVIVGVLVADDYDR